jgi:hypothetical protein
MNGNPLGESTILSTSCMQNRQTTMKINPVTAPDRTARYVTRGALILGAGISSTIWITASNAVSPYAACTSPVNHTTPSLHPVWLIHAPNTNLPG